MSVKDKSGNLHTNTEEILKCWEDHFQSHLNARFPHDPGALTDIDETDQAVQSGTEISHEQVLKTVQSMKSSRFRLNNCRGAKAGGQPLLEILHKIFTMVWKTEKTPKD